jgi:hypothetical protein
MRRQSLTIPDIRSSTLVASFSHRVSAQLQVLDGVESFTTSSSGLTAHAGTRGGFRPRLRRSSINVKQISGIKLHFNP